MCEAEALTALAKAGEGAQMAEPNYLFPASDFVRGKGIPDAISFRALLDLIATFLGEDLRFEEVDDFHHIGQSGLTLRVSGAGYIIRVPKSARQELRLFCACHELAHILLGHPVAHNSDALERIESFLATLIPLDRRPKFVYGRPLRGNVVPTGDSKSDEANCSRLADEGKVEAEAELVGQQLALRVLRSLRESTTHEFQFERVFAR